VIETPRRQTDTGILKLFSAEKLIEFGKGKSGKSQEILEIRSCDNPGCVWKTKSKMRKEDATV